MLKKLTVFIIAAAMALSLFGCGQSSEEKTTEQSTEQTQEEAPSETPAEKLWKSSQKILKNNQKMLRNSQKILRNSLRNNPQKKVHLKNVSDQSCR